MRARPDRARLKPATGGRFVGDMGGYACPRPLVFRGQEREGGAKSVSGGAQTMAGFPLDVMVVTWQGDSNDHNCPQSMAEEGGVTMCDRGEPRRTKE